MAKKQSQAAADAHRLIDYSALIDVLTDPNWVAKSRFAVNRALDQLGDAMRDLRLLRDASPTMAELEQVCRQRLRKMAGDAPADVAATAEQAASQIVAGLAVLRDAMRGVRDGGIPEHFTIARDGLIELVLEFLPDESGPCERKGNCRG